MTLFNRSSTTDSTIKLARAQALGASIDRCGEHVHVFIHFVDVFVVRDRVTRQRYPQSDPPPITSTEAAILARRERGAVHAAAARLTTAHEVSTTGP